MTLELDRLVGSLLAAPVVATTTRLAILINTAGVVSAIADLLAPVVALLVMRIRRALAASPRPLLAATPVATVAHAWFTPARRPSADRAWHPRRRIALVG